MLAAKKITFSKLELLQYLLFLLVNGIFVVKYVSRTSINPIVVVVLYSLFIVGVVCLLKYGGRMVSERGCRYVFWGLLVLMVIAIICFLMRIDPYLVQVDRWSAVTFFWDYFFQGKYPYGTTTHVSDINYPSPFPVWMTLNLPFYWMGDVGYNLLFFLTFIALMLRYYFGSYRQPLYFLLLLALSPAYWWEVVVRSDALSNGFLTFGFILWFSKRGYSLSENFWTAVLCCALLAGTRMSSYLPLALFLFKPYMQLPWRKMVLFPLCVLGILLVVFSPFIFWDTQNWVFFSRNPFMSQSIGGNIYLLLIMVAIGIWLSWKWKNMEQFCSFAGVFMFVFFAASQMAHMYMKIGGRAAFDFTQNYDISYFTLAFPYCLCAIAHFMGKGRAKNETCEA